MVLYTNEKNKGRGGINGITRGTNQDNRTNTNGSSRERTSTYESLREARTSLYEQAQGIMRDRATRRRARGQINKAIDSFRDEFQNFRNTVSSGFIGIKEESEHLIKSTKELARAIEAKLRSKEQQEPEQWTPSR
jgi:uncharacterized coiled-coil DUF342 family protein